MNAHITVIAEAGVNHNGDPALALKLVDAAADAGADAVKFQTFNTESLATPAAPKAAYQQRAVGGSEGQFSMLKRLELSKEAHWTILERCRTRGIRFLSTPFDVGSLVFLANDMSVDTIKIGSGNLTDAPLLLAAGRTRLPVILSTGMATLAEVERALGVLAFGYSAPENARPSADEFAHAFASIRGHESLASKVTLLHCTSEYPAQTADANLRAMETMHRAFALPVGLSDHTPGTVAAIAAVALGATVIEKHLTLDRAMPGPDHAASLDPTQFAALTVAVRDAELALGDGKKRPAESESKNKIAARKSLVARQTIAKGDVFTAENLGVLRPGNGVSAIEYFDWIGRKAKRDYALGEVLTP
ncbi:MAG: N-acetylneuraminate synthase [Alphaproteobacteria bacterium]|nr:N-acetylneuraminate synthase [Alphaproteobacteria bacterium]